MMTCTAASDMRAFCEILLPLAGIQERAPMLYGTDAMHFCLFQALLEDQALISASHTNAASAAARVPFQR